MAIRKSTPFNGVVICANTTERTAFFPSAVEGQFAYLKDTNALTYYDGSNWQTISAPSYPSQTGNAGKFLTTDGSSASWGTILDTTAFSSQTPTLLSWTIGNGTVAAYHRAFGKMTTYRGKLTVGSTTTIDSVGTLGFIMPSSTATVGAQMVGSVRWFDTSTSTAYNGLCVVPTSSSNLSLYYDDVTIYTASVLGSWNSSSLTLPFTIASGDTVEWNIVYEAA